MTTRWRRTYLLRPGVMAAWGEAGELALVCGVHGEYLGVPSQALRAVIRRLAAEPPSAQDTLMQDLDGEPDPAELTGLLGRLRRGGWVRETLERTGRPVLTIDPLGPLRTPEAVGRPDVPRLSRFAVLHHTDGGLVLESPLSAAMVTVHDPDALLVIHALATGGHPAQVPGDIVDRVLGELARHGFLVPDRPDPGQPAPGGWSAHELWFHARTRWPSAESPREPGQASVPLARHRGFGSPGIPLHRPDLAMLRQTDISLTAALEDRRSFRTHDNQVSLTMHQLGEFLFRCARIRRIGLEGGHEVVSRPYPAGGSLHELELYVIAGQVRGLEPGMYHYRAHLHELEKVPANELTIKQLRNMAAAAAETRELPHVLIVISARFERVMWKYPARGYALTLKNTGVLLQTMYLVATAMGLAGCALGSGDSDLFAQATGLDPLVEASIGEFILGTRPPESPAK